MIKDDLNKYHFMNYDSPEDFVNTGFGYCVEVDGKVVAACSSGLVCSKGVEICIITQPDYREKGLAALVAAKFILHCIQNNLEPHWDAANPKSVGLAKKLGYAYLDSYEVMALPKAE
jgi:predicted GNAT family acetyltransferase